MKAIFLALLFIAFNLPVADAASWDALLFEVKNERLPTLPGYDWLTVTDAAAFFGTDHGTFVRDRVNGESLGEFAVAHTGAALEGEVFVSNGAEIHRLSTGSASQIVARPGSWKVVAATNGSLLVEDRAETLYELVRVNIGTGETRRIAFLFRSYRGRGLAGVGLHRRLGQRERHTIE